MRRLVLDRHGSILSFDGRSDWHRNGRQLRSWAGSRVDSRGSRTTCRILRATKCLMGGLVGANGRNHVGSKAAVGTKTLGLEVKNLHAS